MKRADIEKTVSEVFGQHFGHITPGTPDFAINKAAQGALIEALNLKLNGKEDVSKKAPSAAATN